MKIRLGLISWATGTLLLAAVSACGGSGADPVPSPSATTSSSAPTTGVATTPPTSPTEVASGDASLALKHYFTVLDRVRQDPSVPLSELATVATSTQLNSQKHLVRAERSRSLHQTGASSIRKLTVQSVTLDNTDPSAGRVPMVSIDVCWDVSQADLVDGAGKSAVSPERKDRGWTRYTVANYRWDANPSGGWRVASSQNLEQTPCAAS